MCDETDFDRKCTSIKRSYESELSGDSKVIKRVILNVWRLNKEQRVFVIGELFPVKRIRK